MLRPLVKDTLEAALQRRARLHGKKITVEVHGQKVILSGHGDSLEDDCGPFEISHYLPSL
jgi:osmotically-inducible protein OsmY